MNELYKFETEQFGLSDEGIHYLRNRFNYKTINYDTIESIEIKKGKDLKNWLWVITIGLALLTFVIYDLISIYLLLNSDTTYVIYIEILLIPLIPLLLWLYSVIRSLRVTEVIVGRSRNENFHLSLRKIIKENQFDEFEKYIKEKIPFITIK